MIDLGPIMAPAIRLRNFLFEQEVISAIELKCKVISIGNITMGGTGKTPMTTCVYQYYKNVLKFKKIGIVARSYKTPLNHPEIVPLSGGDSSLLGDEPMLLKLKCPDAIVVSGPNKAESAKYLLEKEPEMDLIIIDDGFQHRKLKRNLDIVLLDCSIPLEEYSWPLKGRLRESIQGLNRAQVVVLTKMDQQNPETLALVTSRLPADIVLLESYQKIGEPIPVGGAKNQSEVDFENPMFAFCGIAKPENFKKSLESKNIQISEFLSFPDHHFYSEEEITGVLVEKAKRTGFAITTEKDYVRLQNKWPENGPILFVLPLEVELRGQLERFYELLKF